MIMILQPISKRFCTIAPEEYLIPDIATFAAGLETLKEDAS